ncbi:MAG: TIM barrel protein [Candidatus Bathyarchaeota archaeon]|nr:TIM barrel protein [Candidatus Bathyarchaeota archaeon]MDH5787559.1 TIM barrel protein [Candidatus Bathyarchaeota archaeon]
MADRARFGPAGVPPTFRLMAATLADVPKLLREEGLDAFEYQAVRWGAKPQIKRVDAEKLGLIAREKDVLISLHGSYFMNFCGNEEIMKASIQRLIACVTAAEWMKAYIVVFHPGFYGERPRIEMFSNCLEGLKEVANTMEIFGIKNVKIGPETMGKPSQLGSLDEILSLCEEIEQAQPAIDWGHLHARNMGRFKTVDDFRRVIQEIERRLGSEAVKGLHCHFTKVEFTDKGERRHRILGDVKHGPEFEMLAKVIAEFKLRPTIISESPVLDLDALKMRDILQKELSS